jgi:hypothetical protein
LLEIGFKKRGTYWIFEKQYLSVSRPRNVTSLLAREDRRTGHRRASPVERSLRNEAGVSDLYLCCLCSLKKLGVTAQREIEKVVRQAKPKSAPVKKAARRVKQPVAPAVETVAETVAVKVIEQSVPDVTEVEEARKAS